MIPSRRSSAVYYPTTMAAGDRRSQIKMELKRRESLKQMLEGHEDKLEIKNNNHLTNRSCTDVICLIVFVIAIVCWIVLAIFAFKTGDAALLLVPMNTHKLRCGIDKPVRDKPFLVFFNIENCLNAAAPLMGCVTPMVCVEQCPLEFFIFDLIPDYPDMVALRHNLLCDENFDKSLIKSRNDAQKLITNETCARNKWRSTAVLGRCLPIIDSKFTDQIKEGVEKNLPVAEMKEAVAIFDALKSVISAFDDVKASLKISYRHIIFGLLFGLVVCLLFITVMRWLAGPVVWISIFGCISALGSVVAFSVFNYKRILENPEHKVAPEIGSNPKKELVKYILSAKDLWLWILIISSILLVVIVLMIIFLRKRINIAIALIKEGSRAVSSISSSVFFPLIPWILQFLVIVFGVSIGLHLASIQDLEHKISGFDKDQCVCENITKNYSEGSTCRLDDFNKYCHDAGNSSSKCLTTICSFYGISTGYTKNILQGYNVFVLLWVTFFVSAFGEMVLASTFSTWYWTFHKSDVPVFAVIHGITRTVRYHLGTIAFGSLILTLCRIVRAILEYIDQKTKKLENKYVKYAMCCCKCFFWCLEKFLKFLNKNAYIMCAIKGTNFCRSAKDAFELILKNCLRVVALDNITDFLFFLAKVFISVGMGSLMYYCFVWEYCPKLNESQQLLPAIMIAIGTYLVATTFFNVYSMAVDTLFMCFLEDSEKNDGSEERPYFMSKTLMKVLGKKNVADKSEYVR